MSAGATPSQRAGRDRRGYARITRLARAAGFTVSKGRGQPLVVHGAKLTATFAFHWSNMSNGESVGGLTITAKLEPHGFTRTTPNMNRRAMGEFLRDLYLRGKAARYNEEALVTAYWA